MKQTSTAAKAETTKRPGLGAPVKSSSSPSRRKPNARASAADDKDDSSPVPSSVEKIVSAATEMFATQDYAHSTIDEVAAYAGFSKGAVYYYFKDKESLLIEVLKQIEYRSIDTSIQKMKDRGGNARQRLLALVRNQTIWAAEHPRDIAVLMMTALTANATPQVRKHVQQIYGKLSNEFETIINEGKRDGEFTSKQATLDIVLYLLSVHDGNMMIYYRSGTDPELGKRLVKVTLLGYENAVRDYG